MALQLSPGAEIIPGYQLVERVGTGGYGEVWKTTAPGGLTKAIKIVFGQIGDFRAEQELKALSRMKEVRHPFLLSLERFEIIDGQLLIVTELADRSLMERYKACREAGLRGVPRDELLGYLRDAADALDYMNEHYGLQHLDIKPENLLLIGGRIKIADFGLVKDLPGTRVTATGGVTPVYATPEAFDGKVSRFSDQYSLAIVYQEMLTGVRPFPGTTAFQLAVQHTTSPPMLDPLPLSDRPTIARALAKVPEQRFAKCGEMVESLWLAGRGHPLAPPQPDETLPLPEDRRLVETPKTVSPAPGLAADDESLLRQPTEISDKPFRTPARQTPPAAGERVPGVLTSQPSQGLRLRPTLFLGIGGIACWTLRRLRQRLHTRFGSLAAVPIFRLLLLDTDREGLRQARQGETEEALDVQETLLVPLHRPEHYRAKSKELQRWLARRWLFAIPSSLRTEGLRPLGRLALVDNAADVLSQLRETLSDLTSPAAKAATRQATGLGLDSETPQVFIVASIAGGTGGGMLLDLAYAVRQILSELHLTDASICALLAHATTPKPAEKELARINAYATLRELQHFSRLDQSYPGDPDGGLLPSSSEETPFKECYLVHLGDQLNEAEVGAATDALAEYLYQDAATTARESFDRYRQSTHTVPYSPEDDTTLRTFGLSRLSFPRQRLANLAADLFCRQLINRWRGIGASVDERQIEREAAKQATALGLEGEALATRFHAGLQGALNEDPDKYFRQLLADSRLQQTSPTAQPWGELAGQLLGKIDGLLGSGRDADDRGGSADTLFEVAMHDQAQKISLALSRSVEQWLLAIAEDPQRRLKAANYAASWFLQHLALALERASIQLTQFRAHRDVLRRRLIAGDIPIKSTGIRWLSLGKRQEANEGPSQRFLEYWWLRLMELTLDKTAEVLGAVYRWVSAFSQELASCQQKLSLFAELFKTVPPAGAMLSRLGDNPSLTLPMMGRESMPPSNSRPGAVPNLTELLPGQVHSLAEAAEALVKNLKPDFTIQFEENFRDAVLKARGGFWGVVSGSTDLGRALKDELQSRARAAFLEVIKDIDAAKLFLESTSEPGQAHRALLAQYRAAAPRLAVSEGWQHVFLALPAGKDGASLAYMFSQAFPDAQATLLDSEGDVILCQEFAHVPLRQVAASLIEDEAVYADHIKRVLTRMDVTWSPLTPTAPREGVSK